MPEKEIFSVTPKMSGKAIACLIGGCLSFCFSLAAAIPSLLIGRSALKEIGQSQRRLSGKGLAVAGMLLALLGVAANLAGTIVFVFPAVEAARNAAGIAVTSSNLRQIAIGMHNYHDNYKSLPLAGSNDKRLGIGLSWRVRILPHIEQRPLYDRFDLDRPWDSPHNKALIAEMPPIFKAPGFTRNDGKTVYLGVAGAAPGKTRDWRERTTAFDHSGLGKNYGDFLDGMSNAILIVEADPTEAVIWTKPDDWEFDPQSPRHGLGSLRKFGFVAAFGDGKVGIVPNSTTNAGFF